MVETLSPRSSFRGVFSCLFWKSCYRPGMTRILHTQTILHGTEPGKDGNCTQAVLATILGLPLEEVPDFNNIHRDKPHSGWYWNHLRTFCLSKGWHFQMLSGERTYPTLYLASGPSARGVEHFVVMKNGVLYHDPHPSRSGIEHVRNVYILLPVDPADMQPTDSADLPPDQYDFQGNVIGPDLDEDGDPIS